MRKRLRRDMLLCAIAAQTYGMLDITDYMDSLREYGAKIGPVVSPEDIDIALTLGGLDAEIIVWAHTIVPAIVTEAMDRGHMALAQVARVGYAAWVEWTALCDADAHGWSGVALTHDFLEHNIGSDCGYALTGRFVVIRQRIPGWVPPLT